MILLASFGMLALTVWLYGKGEIGFEGIMTCTIAMMGSFGPVVALSSLSNNLNQTLASGERVLSLLEETPMVEEISGNVDIRTDSDNEISNTSIVLENTDNDIRNQNNSPEKEKYILRGILTGRQAGVGAVIASVTYEMGAGIVQDKNGISTVIMVGAFIASCIFEVNVVYVVIVCGLIGVIRTCIAKRRKNK